MRREPGIHITKKRLSYILLKMGYKDNEEMVNQIFLRAKSYSINTRTIIVSNERLEKKASNILKSTRSDAATFARQLYLVRLDMKHRGISPIKAGSREWETVKQVAAQAMVFNEEFNLPQEKGFNTYIRIGLEKMKKFMLNKFLGMQESIFLTYDALLEIDNDEDKDMTHQMYSLYNQHIISNTGIHTNLKDIPEKYVYFVRARGIAEQMNISPKVYINAQFEELDFTKNIPHPSQLVGIKASERVARYCYKHNIKV